MTERDRFLMDTALDIVRAELERATSKFGSFASAHEGFAVIEEEFLELRDVVFWPHKDDSGRPTIELREEEARQLAAMAARFLMDVVLPGMYPEDPQAPQGEGI